MDKKKFYITTAIAYSSRKPHFGNTYESIMADAIARFQRQIRPYSSHAFLRKFHSFACNLPRNAVKYKQLMRLLPPERSI